MSLIKCMIELIGIAFQIKDDLFDYGKTKIGKNNKIFPFASIGNVPQDLKYKGEKTKLIIGDGNTIRENTTINTGTIGGGGLTKIGNNSLLMIGVHIAHDCSIGNNVVIANSGAIAGHAIIDDDVIKLRFEVLKLSFVVNGKEVLVFV